MPAVATQDPIELRVRVLGRDGEAFANRSVWVDHTHSAYEIKHLCSTGRPGLAIYQREYHTDLEGRFTLVLPPDWLEHDELSHLRVLDAPIDGADLGATRWIPSVHSKPALEVQLAPKRLLAAGRFEGWKQPRYGVEVQLREQVPPEARRRDEVDGLDGTRRDQTAIKLRMDLRRGDTAFEFWGWPAGEFVDLRFSEYRSGARGPLLRLLPDLPVGTERADVEPEGRLSISFRIEAPGRALPRNLGLELRSISQDALPRVERIELEAKVDRNGHLGLEHIRPGQLEVRVFLYGNERVVGRLDLPEFCAPLTAPCVIEIESPGDIVQLVAERRIVGPYAEGVLWLRGDPERLGLANTVLLRDGEPGSATVWLDEAPWSLWVRGVYEHLGAGGGPTPPEILRLELPRSESHAVQGLIDDALAALREDP